MVCFGNAERPPRPLNPFSSVKLCDGLRLKGGRRKSEAGKKKKPLRFIFLPVSRHICIGKGGFGALMLLSGGRRSGRVKKRGWRPQINVLLRLTSPAFTKVLPSPPLTPRPWTPPLPGTPSFSPSREVQLNPHGGWGGGGGGQQNGIFLWEFC